MGAKDVGSAKDAKTDRGNDDAQGEKGRTTIAALLRQTGLPWREARRLLAEVLDMSVTWLIAHDQDVPAPPVAERFHALAARRAAGEPLAYVLGWREFYGHRFAVSPAVLIPRPETEGLVEVALECLAGQAEPRVLDLGTGSGAIALSVALARPDAEVWATDFSTDALTVARENAARLGAAVDFAQGSWWDALAPAQQGGFAVIVSNPPYIAADDPHLGRDGLPHEPRDALTDGGDGLAHLRTLVRGAPRWLRPDGWLWLEHGYDQAETVRALFAEHPGWRQIASRRDLAGIERLTGASWRPDGVAAPSYNA
ncbi:MAG: peptide chain release factor N(5)-glutamine methyltransferase [Pigmentiphaga sp.]